MKFVFDLTFVYFCRAGRSSRNLSSYEQWESDASPDIVTWTQVSLERKFPVMATRPLTSAVLAMLQLNSLPILVYYPISGRDVITVILLLVGLGKSFRKWNWSLRIKLIM